MPEVPYQPEPTVQPAERVLRPGGVPSVPEAFGVGVAHAVSTFGGKVETAGSEVFDRAIALRRLDIDNQVRDNVTDLTGKIAPVQNHFLTQEGYNADGNAMQQHLVQIEQMHRDQRAQLEGAGIGPYGLKKFDDEYASMQRSFTREAILHSARQTRVAQDASVDASVNSRLDLIRNAQTTDEFDKFIQDVPSIAQDKANFKGEGQEWTDRLSGTLTSKAIIARTDALARVGKYQEARDFVNTHEKQIIGEDDRSRVQLAVNNSEDKFQAHSAAQAAIKGFAPYMTPQEVDRTAGVSPVLLDIMKQAQANHPEIEMTIGDKGGRRTLAEQAQLVAAGRSQTLKSGHLDGSAMDVVGRTNNRPDYENTALQGKVDSAMREAAEQLNVILRPQISWDKYHFQLAKDFDPNTARRLPPPSLQEARDRTRAYLTDASPTNPGLPDSGTEHVDREWRAQRMSENSQFLDAKEQIENGIISGQIRTKSDVPTELIDQARKSGATGAAWVAGLEPNIKKHVDNDNDWSQLREDNYHRLKGMANELEHQGQFTQMDLYKEDLRASDRADLIKDQRSVKAGKLDPTRLKASMQDLGPLLEANGIRRSKTDDEQNNRYLMFQGMLQARLGQIAARGEPVPHDVDSLQKLARPLLRTIGGSWSASQWTGLSGQWSHPYFQPPDVIAHEINQNFRRATGADRDLDPEEMGQMFHHFLNTPYGQQRMRAIGATDYVTTSER